MNKLDKDKILVFLDKLIEVNPLSQAYKALKHVRDNIDSGKFDCD